MAWLAWHLAGLVIVLGGVVLLGHPSAWAQEATPVPWVGVHR